MSALIPVWIIGGSAIGLLVLSFVFRNGPTTLVRKDDTVAPRVGAGRYPREAQRDPTNRGGPRLTA